MVLSRISLLVAVAPLALAACGGDTVQRTFGVGRQTPDEFQVTTRAPLSMPPDFMLRPPRPGAPRPQEMTAPQEAEATLAPQSALAPRDTSTTAGQQALVASAGPSAPANIRRQVDVDAASAETSRGFTEELMFWRKPEDKSVVVDPQRESQRLRQNAALGAPTTAGDTPIIQKTQKGVVQKLVDSIF
jgi:hypothetical protein